MDFFCILCYNDGVPCAHRIMQISRDKLKDLRELQEDMAEYFVDSNFPISGETYWTCIQCLAEAKLAQLQGEIV